MLHTHSSFDGGQPGTGITQVDAIRQGKKWLKSSGDKHAKGTYPGGEEWERARRLLCDPGFELRLLTGESENKKGEDIKWNEKRHYT